jgi:pyridoxal phosphate enzyme (YggS family)
MFYFVPMQTMTPSQAPPSDSSPWDRIQSELRNHPACTLVAVSKTRSVDEIRELYDRGQRDFGENHALELQSKARELPADIRWHFIGHLQTNKVKTILPFVHLIHSVDSPRLVDEIQKRAAAANRQVGILWQVHIAQEETKHGFEPESLLQFLEKRPPSTYPNLRPCGLMGMATLSDQSEDTRPEFAFLKKFSDRVKQRFYAKDSGFDVLSMGMSGDYSIALQEGSTMLRIGSLLFER